MTPAVREGEAKQRFGEEHGAIAVLFALTIVILFAAVAFVIDISRLYHERQVLQNAVDFGALAGSQDLPVQGSSQATATTAVARSVAIANAPEIGPGGPTVTYECVIAIANGLPDLTQVPYVCGPSSGTWSSGWTLKPTRAVHACDPFAGDKCNTIRLTTTKTIPYYFAPVIGVNTGSTGSVNAASCNGACGAASSPLDVVMVLDRTGSMTAADVANVKNAALSILGFYDSSTQWVGLITLPYGDPSNKCIAFGNSNAKPPTYQMYPDANYTDWQAVPLSNDFTGPGGTVNNNSALVKGINCLQGAPGTVQAMSDGVGPSGNHTNLGDPVDAARAMLAAEGRANVPDVIIFETDGQANQPSTRQPCNYFNTKATAAKTAGDTIFTLAYGLDNPPVKCTDSSAPWAGKYATTNLAGAATSSTDDQPGGCGPNENKDGDDYFCVPGSSDLEPIFRAAAAASLSIPHLIE
ncbi:MAG: TadE/TadG family type IV pilus assembly protein [Actinomycetota bacterium]